MTTFKFEKGDRVQYIGTYTPEQLGQEGVVICQNSERNVDVYWDDERLNGSVGSWGVFPDSIRKINFTYDPTQAGDTDEDV